MLLLLLAIALPVVLTAATTSLRPTGTVRSSAGR